jgi:hypothetical protein
MIDRWEEEELKEREALKDDITKEKKAFTFSKEFKKQADLVSSIIERLENLKRNLEQRKIDLSNIEQTIEKTEADMSKALETGNDTEVEKVAKKIQELRESQRPLFPIIENLETRTIPKAENELQSAKSTRNHMARKELREISSHKLSQVVKHLDTINRSTRAFDIAQSDMLEGLGIPLSNAEEPISMVNFVEGQGFFVATSEKIPTASGNNDLAPYV